MRQFWRVLSPNKKWRKIFSLSCPRHCDWGLTVVVVYQFQIWNKKQHIIFRRVISRHIGLMYIEKPIVRTVIGFTISLRVELGVMSLKWYFIFLKAPKLRPHRQIQLSAISRTLFGEGFLAHLKRCSRRILQPQPTRLLFICIDR